MNKLNPKVVIFDLDRTLWPSSLIRHNAEHVHRSLGDDNEYYLECQCQCEVEEINFYKDVPDILLDCHHRGIFVAAASLSDNVEAARDVLENKLISYKAPPPYLKVPCLTRGHSVIASKLFNCIAIQPTGTKRAHNFENIRRKSGCRNEEMLLVGVNAAEFAELGMDYIQVEDGISMSVFQDKLAFMYGEQGFMFPSTTTRVRTPTLDGSTCLLDLAHSIQSNLDPFHTSPVPHSDVADPYDSVKAEYSLTTAPSSLSSLPSRYTSFKRARRHSYNMPLLSGQLNPNAHNNLLGNVGSHITSVAASSTAAAAATAAASIAAKIIHPNNPSSSVHSSIELDVLWPPRSLRNDDISDFNSDSLEPLRPHQSSNTTNYSDSMQLRSEDFSIRSDYPDENINDMMRTSLSSIALTPKSSHSSFVLI